MAGNEWLGSDSSHSDLHSLGLKVYGSSIHGDGDTGLITLRLRLGDRLFYRSGPNGGRQKFTINGGPAVALPVVLNWTFMEFNGPNLPSQEFVATFTDAGNGYGEWSAIALKDGTVPDEPIPLLHVADPSFSVARVTSNEIDEGNEWIGRDSLQSNLCPDGLQVYGSHMAKGDGDVGSIRLHVHNRDRFFYRSGPAPGKQTLEIPGVPGITLPATGEWSVLDVAALGLPEGSITLTLSDKGTGWGEWSAIAVRELRACH